MISPIVLAVGGLLRRQCDNRSHAPCDINTGTAMCLSRPSPTQRISASRKGEAVIGSGHTHIERGNDRMRQQEILDDGIFLDGLVDMPGFWVG